MKTTSRPLAGKVVVVTGASSGAGKAIAVAFAEAGAHVVAAARRQEALEETVRTCAAQGVKSLAVVTDVTDTAAVQRLAEAASQLTGRIDVWVNNAGILAVGETEKTPVDVLDRVIQTNLSGYLHGIHAVLPYFKRQKAGILINNISIGGYLPVPYGVAYSASKFGLRGMTEALQAELSPHPSIHVCALYPAFLDTPGIQHAANYLGVKVKAAPPVFDPLRVAKAAVELAVRPKPATYTDWAGPLFKFAYAVVPGLTRRIASLGLGAWKRTAETSPETSGNAFATDTPHTGIHGGWEPPIRNGLRNAAAVGLGAMAALAFLRLKRA